MPHRLAALFAGLALTIAPIAAAGAPVDEADRIPLDLRRTTLVVSDIDRSLVFYRDTLGMVAIYDAVIRTPRDAPTTAEAERELRLVFLRANDTYVGVLGLLEYAKPEKTADPQDRTPFQPGDVVLLFNTEDVAGLYEAAIALDGVEAVAEPTPTEYPSYDGQGVLRVITSTVLDPDGHAVEINQLLDTLH
ncbi:MAG: VOC family protein [Caulobacterales bacterium]|nr:VOC family protein [Caulobacterales bacterium]